MAETMMDEADQEECEIASRLEVEAIMQQEFAESGERVALYRRWKDLHISGQVAQSMSGLDWMSLLYYNAALSEVILDLFDFFEEFLLQPMHSTWMKPGALNRRIPPVLIKEAMQAGLGDYARMPLRVFLVGAYVDAFHPEESIAQVACREQDVAMLKGAAKEAVSVFETLVEHMGRGRLPSADMVGHFPSLLMTYAIQTVRTRVGMRKGGAAAKDEASAAAARDWYVLCLERAAAEALRRGGGNGNGGSTGDNGRRPCTREDRDEAALLRKDEWTSVAQMLRSYRAILMGMAGGTLSRPAKAVSTLPYVPFAAYSLRPERMTYEAVMARGLERARGGGLGACGGEGMGQEEEDDGAAAKRRRRGKHGGYDRDKGGVDGGVNAADAGGRWRGGATTPRMMTMSILPNPIGDRPRRDDNGEGPTGDAGVQDEDCLHLAGMSWEESQSRMGPHSLLAARRAFELFRDAYWERFMLVKGVRARGDGRPSLSPKERSLGRAPPRDADGDEEMEDDDDEDQEDERAREAEGGATAVLVRPARRGAASSDGAHAVRVLQDLLCALKDVLVTQGGHYSYSRLNEDKGLERLHEVAHVCLTGRTPPGTMWEDAVAVIRCMFRYLMFKCSLLAPGRVLELHRGRDLRMWMLEQQGAGEGGSAVERRGRRKAMLDAIRFLVETTQHIRWDADNARVVRLSPFLERSARYVLAKAVGKGIASEAMCRRKGWEPGPCSVCERHNNDGLGRLRAWMAHVCRDEPVAIAAASSSSAPPCPAGRGKEDGGSEQKDEGVSPRVRLCVIKGIVRKLIGGHSASSAMAPFSWDAYNRDGEALPTIPEGYEECAACTSRQIRGGFWLPETLAVFDDARLRRLRRRFAFVVRMEALLFTSVRFFKEVFGSARSNAAAYQARVDEAVGVLMAHMRRVVDAEAERGWGAWSERDMRAVLHAAIQFRTGPDSEATFLSREVDGLTVDVIMDRSSPLHAVNDAMMMRRMRNAEKVLLSGSGGSGGASSSSSAPYVRGGASKASNSSRKRKSLDARSEETETEDDDNNNNNEEAEEPGGARTLELGLARRNILALSAEELSLNHDGCEILVGVWSEVLLEASLIVDLTLEVSGGYYTQVLDELFQRNPGLATWIPAPPSAAAYFSLPRMRNPC